MLARPGASSPWRRLPESVQASLAQPPLRFATGRDSGDESDPLGDESDFSSGELGESLMEVGQFPGCEADNGFSKWTQRARTKRRKLRQGYAAVGRPSAVQARQSSGMQMVRPEVQQLINKGQCQYADGKLEEAMETMQEAVRLQPEVVAPYHVLTVIHEERRDVPRMLKTMLLAAYFTRHKDESRRLWHSVALRSKQEGLMDQAFYAFKRSIIKRGKKNTEDMRSMSELVQLYEERGQPDSAISMMYCLYEATEDELMAKGLVKQLAGKLVKRHRWRECQELLDAYIEGCLLVSQKADVDVINVYCEVLLEVREFVKCSNLLVTHFDLPMSAPSTSVAEAQPDHTEKIMECLRLQPVDLLGKLAVALSHIHLQKGGEPGLLCESAIAIVSEQPPEFHGDIYLSIVDALLADDGVASERFVQHPGMVKVWHWGAERAQQLLATIEHSGLDEDLRERRAKCLWRAGQTEEAARLLQSVLDSAIEQGQEGARTEADLRELRVRVAEAWDDAGHFDLAHNCLATLTFDDIKRVRSLPRPMSSAQRLKTYKDLSAIIEQAQTQPPDIANVQSFTTRFRHLVYDCELDYERLMRLNAGMSISRASVQAADQQQADANGTIIGEIFYGDGNDRTDLVPKGRSDQGCAADAQSADDLAPVAAAELEAAANQFALVPVGTTQPESLVSHHSSASRPGLEMESWQSKSTMYKTKRRHLGIESVEDSVGLEAYLAFVVRGILFLRNCGFGRESGARGSDRVSDYAGVVELCEMILANRRLVSFRNPVKRRMLKELALTSVSLAFEARLWPVVFRHLRMCEKILGDDTAYLALFMRVLFTHAEVDFLQGTGKDNAPVAWKRFIAFSASSHRNTYSAAFADVRSWAFRRLSEQPRSFGLTLLCAHFCVVARQYKSAFPLYLRAHRLAPRDPLTCLCVGASYLSFAMSRTAMDRHDLVLRGLTFIQRYKSLRLAEFATGAEASSGKDSIRDPADWTACRAEVAYNLGRTFHQLGINNLAAKEYHDALAIFDAFDESSSTMVNSPESGGRKDLRALRSSCAYNLASLYRSQDSHMMARQILWKHIAF